MCWNSVLRGGYRRWSQISSKLPSPEENKRRPAGAQDLLWWLKKALSNRINSRHPYLNEHRLVMSSPRRVSGQPYPVVEWMRPMGMRWHLGNRRHFFSLVGYLCRAQQRDQAVVKKPAHLRDFLLGCNQRRSFLRFTNFEQLNSLTLFVFFSFVYLVCLCLICFFYIRKRM